MLTMLGAIAAFEHDLMLERQREGIAKAAAEGKYKGRAPTARAKAADVLKKAQQLDDTEHQMIPFIEKFRSIKQAVEKFGRI